MWMSQFRHYKAMFFLAEFTWKVEKLFVELESVTFGGEKLKNELFLFTILWKTVFDGVGLDFLSKKWKFLFTT